MDSIKSTGLHVAPIYKTSPLLKISAINNHDFDENNENQMEEIKKYYYETGELKKEIVYVPLPTDDEELLKKGPFVAPGEDKKK